MPRVSFKIYPRQHDLEVRTGGLRFLFFYGIVALASINTGNNLLYLILATLTAAVLLSWFLATVTTRGLRASVELPGQIYAQEETTIHFFAENTNSVFSSQSLTFTLRSQGEPRLHLPFIDVLESGERLKIPGLVTYPRRGRFTLEGLEVNSTYPFGILKRTRAFKSPGHILVFPHIMPLEKIVRLGMEGLQSLDSVYRGQDGGLINLREFLPGDDPRTIHWKASARTDQLMVKELARKRGRFLYVYFNPLTNRPSVESDQELFEQGVSVAASLAYHALEDGIGMILTAPGMRLGPRQPGDSVQHFMEYLAEVKLKRVSSVPTGSNEGRRQDEFAIIVDPLNDDVDWGSNAVVLDRGYMQELEKEDEA